MTETVIRLLEEIVAVRERRYERGKKLLGSGVAADEVDVLAVELLQARLELAREKQA